MFRCCWIYPLFEGYTQQDFVSLGLLRVGSTLYSKGTHNADIKREKFGIVGSTLYSKGTHNRRRRTDDRYPCWIYPLFEGYTQPGLGVVLDVVCWIYPLFEGYTQREFVVVHLCLCWIYPLFEGYTQQHIFNLFITICWIYPLFEGYTQLFTRRCR